jgi:thioredoxin 1
MLKHLESKDFEKEVLNSEKLILVDFFATWCGPCQMLGPVLERLAPNVEFDIAKINIDEAQELAIKYGVEVVPTMLIFKNGQSVGQLVGYADENKIKAEVEKYI